MIIKLKEEAPWNSIKLPGEYIISKGIWVDYRPDAPGFKGIEHLVEYKEEAIISENYH